MKKLPNQLRFLQKDNLALSILFLSLLCIAFILPLNKIWSSFPIIILSLSWLFSANFKVKFQQLLSRPFFLFVIGFFLFHCLGLLWTNEMEIGLFDVQKKLSFLILPLVIGSIKLSNRELDLIKRAFIYGCLLACMLILSLACYKYLQTGDRNMLFYHHLSGNINHHPGVLSLYITLAMAFLIDELFKQHKLNKLQIAALLFLGVLMVMLASRMIMLIAFVMLNAYVGYKLYHSTYKKKGLIVFIAVFAVLCFSILVLPGARNRFKSAFVQENVRTTIYKCVKSELSSIMLTGVGTGDVNQLLNEAYSACGFQRGIDKGLNAHNQYLQTFLGLGIVALLWLIGLLLWPIISSRNNSIYTFCLVMIGLAFLTEVYLNVSAGAVFTSFFICVLWKRY